MEPRGSDRAWHVYGRDGFGDPPDVDYWTEDESQARVAKNAGHKVVEYARVEKLTEDTDRVDSPPRESSGGDG